MGLPNFVTIKKNGVEYKSGVERSGYVLTELTRAAFRDVGKFIQKKAREKVKPHKKSGRMQKNMQYWVRGKGTFFPTLQVGYKRDGFYGGFFELGTSKIPKIAPFFSAISENIEEIRKIEGQYLSAIENENKAIGLIDESETIGEE